MKLLTQAIKKKLPKLYSQEDNEDPMVVCKFFSPDSSYTWFILEGEEEKENGDWRFFNKCYSHNCPDGELGYVMLSELKRARGPLGLGVERDMYFKPRKLSECRMGV